MSNWTLSNQGNQLKYELDWHHNEPNQDTSVVAQIRKQVVIPLMYNKSIEIVITT